MTSADDVPSFFVTKNPLIKGEVMGNCERHPRRQTSYRCAKYDTYQCRECLRCKDPKLYCKHRPSCAIYMITERGLDPDA